MLLSFIDVKSVFQDIPTARQGCFFRQPSPQGTQKHLGNKVSPPQIDPSSKPEFLVSQTLLASPEPNKYYAGNHERNENHERRNKHKFNGKPKATALTGLLDVKVPNCEST